MEKYNELDKVKQEHQEQILQMNKQMSSLKGKATRAENKKEKDKVQTNKKEESLKRDIAELKKEHGVVQQALKDKLKEAREHFTPRNRLNDGTIKQLTKQVNKLSNELSKVKTNKACNTITMTEYRCEIDKLQAEIKDLERKNKRMKKQAEKYDYMALLTCCHVASCRLREKELEVESKDNDIDRDKNKKQNKEELLATEHELKKDQIWLF